MRVGVVTGLSAVCAGALLAAAPAPASACSGPGCVEAEFFPARGTVPANLPAVLFWPASRWRADNDAGPDSVVPSDVRFVRLDAAGPVEVAFELVPSDEPSTRVWAGSHGAPAYRIVPEAELQAGARYALWTRDCRGDIFAEPPREPYDSDRAVGREPPAPYAVFDTTAAAALPGELGSLTVSDPTRREVRLGGGSGCWELYEAASVIAEVERAGEPFFDAIAFVTYVDDKVYRPSPHLNHAPGHGGSWIGHGRDELASICHPDISAPLSSGRHTVRFEGRVAGADETLVGESIEFELSCAGSADGGSADAGRGPDALDAGARDAGADGAEGGPGARDSDADAADPSDAARGSRAVVRGGGDSGGCTVAGDARGGVLAVLLALAMLRRRATRRPIR
jgi:hypothetical protein